jgi:hypothetical protein
MSVLRLEAHTLPLPFADGSQNKACKKYLKCSMSHGTALANGFTLVCRGRAEVGYRYIFGMSFPSMPTSASRIWERSGNTLPSQ